MIASPNDTVRLDIMDAVATITINRPDSLNAINDDVVTALIDITGALLQNADVRCVVLTGAGDHFMAGGDVKRFKKRFDEAQDDAETKAWFSSILGRIHIVVENALPTASPARSLELALPAIIVSVAPISIYDSCEPNIGTPIFTSCLNSVIYLLINLLLH